jgi:hypothetical protein
MGDQTPWLRGMSVDGTNTDRETPSRLKDVRILQNMGSPAEGITSPPNVGNISARNWANDSDGGNQAASLKVRQSLPMLILAPEMTGPYPSKRGT